MLRFGRPSVLCLYVCSFGETDGVIGPLLSSFSCHFVFSVFLYTMPIVALIADRGRSPRQEGQGRASELNDGRNEASYTGPEIKSRLNGVSSIDWS